jgi:hypothetical protein
MGSMRKVSVIGGLAALLPLGFVGCGSRVEPSTGSATDFDHDVVVSMSLTVKPGEELHKCQYVALPTDSEIEVVAFSHKYTKGSHHFLVYATDLDTVPADMQGQYDCTNGDEPVMNHTTGMLYGAQSPAATFPFPAGVGFKMKAHQVVMLQAHYLNPTSADIAATISAGFDTAPESQIQQQASFLLFYDPFIYVPAQGTAVSGIRCSVPRDINIITASTHYHQRGTGMRAFVDPSMSQATSAPFLETHDWEHPVDFNGPLAVKAGSAFRTECSYSNAASTDVFQGPNAATSEMCVLFGLYYPRIEGDFNSCADISINGSGTQACTDVLTCVQGCPASEAPRFTPGGVIVGACWERCMAAGCQGAVDSVLPVSICASEKCGSECNAGDDPCTACVTTNCSAQVAGCLTQKCGG